MGPSLEQLAVLRAREQKLAVLIGRAAQGDQMALASLYDETSPLVHGLALKILRDRFAAEDVTLDVYLQVYRRAATYDPERGTPSAWLLTLTRSRAIDRLRMESQRLHREVPLETAAALPSHESDPEAESVVAELREVVRRALAALTPEQRQALEIAYYAGLSHREIAARLEKPVGTVKTRIRTGMMQLRRRLRPFLPEERP